MIKAFKKHLNIYFLFFPKTKKLKDFKEELLGVMMEKYEDYVRCGMDSKVAVDKCIASIDDYKETIEHLAHEKSEDLTTAQRKLIVFIGMAFVAFVTLVFFVVSLAVGWEYSWLTWIGGVVVAMIGIGFFLLRKAQRNSSFIIARCVLPIVVLLMATAVYLIVSFALRTEWAMTWLSFVLALPIWYIGDIVYRIRHKAISYSYFDWIVSTFIVAVAIFLITGFCTQAWNITWITFIIWQFVVVFGILIKKTIDYLKMNRNGDDSDKTESNDNKID